MTAIKTLLFLFIINGIKTEVSRCNSPLWSITPWYDNLTISTSPLTWYISGDAELQDILQQDDYQLHQYTRLSEFASCQQLILYLFASIGSRKFKRISER